jgi:hypothetical protein
VNAATVCLRLVIFGNGTASLHTYRGGERDEDSFEELGILLRAPTSHNIIFSKSNQIKIPRYFYLEAAGIQISVPREP